MSAGMDSRLEAADVVEDVAMLMWTELVKIHATTSKWRLVRRWRRKWMTRTAWALYLAARDNKKIVEEIWSKERGK